MEIKIEQETCCAEGCGITFWLEQRYRARLLSTKRSFCCPNGHSMNYQGESDKDTIARLQGEKAQILRETQLTIEKIKAECSQSKNKRAPNKKK